MKIPGGIYGLFSVSLGALFIFLSYLNFPGYDMINNDVSVLGIGPGLAPLFFFISLILIGIFAIPFYIFLGRIIIEANEKLTRRAVKLSVIGCIALSMIAFFPVTNLVIGIIHASLAVVYFVSKGIAVIFFSLIMLRGNKFSKIHAYYGFFISILIVFYIIVRWSIVEWIVFFAIGAWVLDISIFTLLKC